MHWQMQLDYIGKSSVLFRSHFGYEVQHMKWQLMKNVSNMNNQNMKIVYFSLYFYGFWENLNHYPSLFLSKHIFLWIQTSMNICVDFQVIFSLHKIFALLKQKSFNCLCFLMLAYKIVQKLLVITISEMSICLFNIKRCYQTWQSISFDCMLRIGPQ